MPNGASVEEPEDRVLVAGIEETESEEQAQQLEPVRDIREDPAYQKLVADCRKQVGNIIRRYWDIGGKIGEFMSRAGRGERYGKGIYVQLSRDLGIDPATLYQTRKFSETVPKGELDSFLELPWSKTRRLTPLLEHPKAHEAVLEEIEVIKETNPEEFQGWLEGAYEKHLDREFKKRGRKEGQKTDFLKSLQKLAENGDFKPEVREFENKKGKGFVAAISWREGQSTTEVRKMLEELLARLGE